MIDEISGKLTAIIKRNSGPMDKDREDIIRYGLDILIYEALMTIFIFTVSLLLGVFLNALVLFVTNGILRKFAGGAHARARISCAASYIIAASAVIILSKYLWSGSLLPSLPLLLAEFYIVYRYAPGDTVEKPLESKKLIRRLKYGAFFTVTAIFLAAAIIWNYNREIYNLLLLSTLPAMFFLTPAGYKVLNCHPSKEACNVQASS